MQAVMFGWGTFGQLLKRAFETYGGLDIVAICDNDKNKWGG